MLYESRETRVALLKSGMEKGVAATYDRLAEVLASREACTGAIERGAGGA